MKDDFYDFILFYNSFFWNCLLKRALFFATTQHFLKFINLIDNCKENIFHIDIILGL